MLAATGQPASHFTPLTLSLLLLEKTYDASDLFCQCILLLPLVSPRVFLLPRLGSPSCHVGSASLRFVSHPLALISKVDSSKLSTSLDNLLEFISDQLYGKNKSRVPDLYLSRDRSYVLLAACSVGEQAYESREYYGAFTKALVDCLRRLKIDRITYQTLIGCLPSLSG